MFSRCIYVKENIWSNEGGAVKYVSKPTPKIFYFETATRGGGH